MAYQIRSNLHLPIFDRTGVTCISQSLTEPEKPVSLCLYQIRSDLHLPYGGEREGAVDDYRRNLVLFPISAPLNHISPHLTSPVGEGQIHLTA